MPVALPLTYVECRARFHRAAEVARIDVTPHEIAARGPAGEALTIDVCHIGPPSPQRALVVMSGVHGVEGFAGSALQAGLLTRLDAFALPAGMAVLVVHAVNPWGMAWWRRQNEHNVDLNRNWRRTGRQLEANEAYDEIHAVVCADGAEPLTDDELLAAASSWVRERGLTWVRDAITVGQYRHADGLHFGGDRTEESTAIVATVVAEHLTGAERVLTLDLHTGHGPWGAITLLSDQPIGSAQDVFLRAAFGDDAVEATAGNPAATTGVKHGQIANGFADVLPGTACIATSIELGTVDDATQLVATYHEHWWYRRPELVDPRRGEATWRYRCCFTPDDRAWEGAVLPAGAALLDTAVRTVAGWA